MTAFKYTSMTIVGALSLIMLSRGIANADELIVRVNNIGEIHIAIYDSAEAFEADRGEKGGAAPGITQGTIEMVEPGSVTYRYDAARHLRNRHFPRRKSQQPARQLLLWGAS